ncbi:acetate--CoA ligase family protein [Marine Group I thaumarchaeote]|uniref:Acetate--CoA ligase family protein n=1 Tax=Marine Group I thaumarchaeote TaxID=2511932 RepID=A0A7K4MTD6_9ARCH|nr:acyl-CoA synthetase [Candidatus Nitrosopumilus sp. MTA1]NWJ19680.1 acetate--CoA ligase family protein [Marine Group I thaumarchaeote]NWJ28075.1 acetate--CoA ligase family protein [Marine Group I thaumarchaeote]NWJ56752.1 acetate--CoA ligase family protein [Marine Group I thaumarchaeote]NWJ83449.1 acetate--CoA ligase family protein [Marine Group I thaumarchaeote]
MVVVKKIFEEIIQTKHKIITEELSKSILKSYGVKVPPFALVTTVEDAAKQAKKIGFPLVMKVVSPQILHKTDVGGVKVGLENINDVKKTFNDMYGRLSKKKGVEVKGILLEKMVPKGVELIVGLQNDSQFGPVIMVGLGGIMTEVMKDVAFRMLPITTSDAKSMINELKGSKLLKGFRGSAPIDLNMVSQMLVRIGKLGVENADHFNSIDFNPVIVYPKSYFVVDAKIILNDTVKKNSISKAKPNITSMESFFTPKAVALVGASATPGKIGNSVLDALGKQDYKGKVYPINPKQKSILGIKCYPLLDAIKAKIDLVVVCIDLAACGSIMKTCAKKGIHNVVIVSGGGKELGGNRAAMEAEVKELALKHKIRVIGPNCIGMFNAANRLDCAFQGQDRMIRSKLGNVAFFSQSGTMGISMLESADLFGLSKMISYGNRSDVDEADMIWYAANDPQTKVIGLYVEGFGDGRKFINTAKRVMKEKKKPIVIWKSGRTALGAKQAASHTGSLGGSNAIIMGAFKQAGIISVDSYQELVGVLKALAWQPPAKGNRIAMTSNGAGPMIGGIDHLERLGLTIGKLSPRLLKKIKARFPPTVPIHNGNPADVGGGATADDYRFVIQQFYDEKNIDIAMPWFVFQDDPLEETIVGYLDDFSKKKKKPILVGCNGGPYTEKMIKLVEKHNIPVYQDIRTWIAAASALAQWGKVRGK